MFKVNKLYRQKLYFVYYYKNN